MYSTETDDLSTDDHVIRGENGDQSQKPPEQQPLQTRSNDAHENDQSYEEGASFGWWRFRPKILKFLNKPKGFLVAVCVTSLSLGIISDGFISTTITTVEKRFRLSSSQSGTIPGSYDFAAAAASILLSSLVKSRRMKLRCIAMGTALIGCGAMLYGLPHFLVGPHVYGALKADVCVPNGNNTQPECTDEGTLQQYLYVFVFGQVAMGMGGTPLYMFGFDLVEMSAPPNQGGLYLGILNAFRGLATAAGFLLSGQLLGLYIDVDKTDAVLPTAGVADPRWLGAWWLGFFLLGAVLLIMSVVNGGFSQEFLPHAAQQVPNTKNADLSRPRVLYSAIRDLLGEVLTLGRNVCLVATVLGFMFGAMVFAGQITYAIKFLEVQFALPPARASLMLGATIVPGGVLGSFLPGIVMKKFRVGVKGALKMACVFAGTCTVVSTYTLIRCANTDFAGVTVPYHDRFGPPDPPLIAGSAILSDCNSNCSCTPYYNPVCGRNGLTYFSPCHAGCVEHDLPKQTYSTCSCVDWTTTAPGNSTGPAVVPGHCENNCGLLPPLLVMIFIFSMAFSAMVTVAIFVVLRCVEERQRSMAIGMASLVARLLGAIPGPIIFGALVDRSCLLWGQTCGARGACILYHTADMSTYLFIASFITNVLITACLLLALYDLKKKHGDDGKAIDVNPRPLRLSIVMDMAELDSTSD